MGKDIIDLFIWGYQRYFRHSVEFLMGQVLQALGVADPKVDCILVGVRCHGVNDPNPVCVEPERSKWPLELFDGLLGAIEHMHLHHPRQNVRYTDEATMRDHPENMYRDSMRRAVRDALGPFDVQHQVVSVTGWPAPVRNHYVVPVVQIPKSLFERYRPLKEPLTDGYFLGPPSFVHAAVDAVLEEAHDELLRPDPGRHSRKMRSPQEVVLRAADALMRSPAIATGDRNYLRPNLFERCNLIASLMYERAESKGRMLLAKPDGGAVEILTQFREPVPFSKARWARKVLQMASSEVALVADYEKVLGLGNIVEGIDPWDTQNVFEIEFQGNQAWRLKCGNEILLVSRFGVPSLPAEGFPMGTLVDTFSRLFPQVDNDDKARFCSIFEAAITQDKGNMLVVAEDAPTEADRLRRQGARVVPVRLTPELYRRVSGIDGTIIVDPQCICYAIGVILDGPAHPECTPERGSRYNSAVRYIKANAGIKRLAIVVSDDRTVDVIPSLRPQVRLSEVKSAVEALESSTRDNYHGPYNRVSQFEFYLSQAECDRVNAALNRIKNEPVQSAVFEPPGRQFIPHPDFDESYFLPESMNLDMGTPPDACAIPQAD